MHKHTVLKIHFHIYSNMIKSLRLICQDIITSTFSIDERITANWKKLAEAFNN